MLYVKYESMQGTPEQLVPALNEIREYCNEIKFLCCQLGMDQFNRPIFITLVELHFKGHKSIKDYEDKFNKPKGIVS